MYAAQLTFPLEHLELWQSSYLFKINMLPLSPLRLHLHHQWALSFNYPDFCFGYPTRILRNYFPANIFFSPELV